MLDFLKDMTAAIINYCLEAGGLDISDNLSFTKLEGGVDTLINSVMNYFDIFCIGLAIIYFLIEMNEKWMMEGRDITLKSMMTPFLKLVICIGVIYCSKTIVNYAIGFHNNLMSIADETFTLESEFAETSVAVDDIVDVMWEGVGLLTKIAMLPLLLIFLLVSKVVSIIFVYKALVFKFEYLIRLMFFPVAMTDVYAGRHSNAVKYFKGLLALTLYALCFVLIPKLGGLFFISDWTGVEGILDMLEVIFAVLVIPIAEIGVLSIAKQTTKEALGA